MDTQLQRVSEKRQDRLEMEKEATHAMKKRLKQSNVGTKKTAFIKREVEQMWTELEEVYHNTKVTELENDLKSKKQVLYNLF
jgi:hypothetical protein